MAQISLRVDDEVKRKAERTLDDIGLSMSAAINIFLKTVVRENRIPFELSAAPFYNETNIADTESLDDIFKNIVDTVPDMEKTLEEYREERIKERYETVN